MPPDNPPRRSLADLPEELIELTLRSITCQSSLAAAALTSRQLYRIAQPILTESVSIFASDDDKPLAQYDNRRRFQQALMDQPDLASSVKTLKLFRFGAEIATMGAFANGGFHMWPQEVASSIPALLNSLPHLEVLDASEYLERSLRRCPIILTIDLWLYKFCQNYMPMFGWPLVSTPPPVCFTRLKVLHVSVILYSEWDLYPLFRLPNLEHLGLHRLTIWDDFDGRVDWQWVSSEDCPIKTLSLTNLHLEMWPEDDNNQLYTIAGVLKHLQTLNITAVNRGHATLALNAFEQRIPQLQTLEAYQNIKDPPELRRIEHETEFERNFHERHLANLLTDEWRNDWLFSALASAPTLKVLHLDVADLHTPASLKDVPGPVDWSASMPALTTYYRDEVYAYASEGDFEDCSNRIQIPLSPAVEEVYLHLRATDMRRYGIGLLHALTQLGLDLPAAAPRLRRVGMVVKENNEERDTEIVWSEMGELFRQKGVVLWRVGA